MTTNPTPPSELLLTKLGINPSNLFADFPGRKLDQYIAVVNWLKKYKPKADATNLDQVKGYIQAFHHLCDEEDWTRASTVISERSITPTGKELHRQLSTWGYPYEQIELCKRLLGKLEPRLEGVLMCSLGIAYDNLGQYQTSIEYHQKHLEIGRQLGNKEFEAAALANLGNDYQSLGEFHRAIEFHKKALDIHYENGNLEGVCSAGGNLGNAYESLGELQIAFEYYEQYLKIARQIGNRESESGALRGLGNTYRAMGQCQLAIQYLQKALVIHRELGNRTEEAGALDNLGVAYKNLGQYQTAIDCQNQALAIQREVGDKQGEATTLGNLGNCYKNLGQYETAIDYHVKALAICREIGDREGEARAFLNMGNAYGLMEELPNAWFFFMRALLIYDSLEVTHAVNGIISDRFAQWFEPYLSQMPKPAGVSNDVFRITLVVALAENFPLLKMSLQKISVELGNEAAERIVQLIAMAANGE